MNKFDIIVFTNAPNAYAPKRIHEAANKLKLTTKIVNYSDMSCNFEKNLFPSAKSIFIRGMGEFTESLPLKYYIIDHYRKTTKILNLKSFDRWLCLDKITQHIEYQKAGIPIAKSYFFGSNKSARLNLNSVGFPLIAKHNIGSRGVSVYKINNEDDLNLVIKKHDIKTILFQEFLTSGEDLRVIILNGKILGAMKRIAQSGQYLTNYSQGGNVEKYDISTDKNAQDLSLRVANLFKLDYCGVDLMRDNKGNWVVLEVNRACQFEGFEKATGINVAGEVVEYLVK